MTVYHSLIISGKNTYDEWGLIPTSRPVVAMPPVKKYVVNIEGSDSSLDYTDLLMGRPTYGQRTGSWEFMLTPGDQWARVYADLASYLHGVVHRVILEDDPTYFYYGRLEISWKSDQKNSILTIDYELDPFKQSVYSSMDKPWQDMYDSTVVASFTVNGSVTKTFPNYGTRYVVPTIRASQELTVNYNGEDYALVVGINYNAGLALAPGNQNTMTFNGNADVDVEYREVSL